MFVFSIQLILNFSKLVLTNNNPNVQFELCTLNGIIKEWKFCNNLNKLNTEERFVSFVVTLQKICSEFKSILLTINDFEMYSGMDIVILYLENLIKNDTVTNQYISKNARLKKKQQKEEEIFTNLNVIIFLVYELISIYKDCTIQNYNIKTLYLENGKILSVQRYFYFEIDILFDEVLVQLENLTVDLVYLLNLITKNQINTHKFIYCYTNIKKTILKTIIYFVLLFEKRKMFFLKIQKYSKIYKNTLEKIVYLFIKKHKEVNESIKKILIQLRKKKLNTLIPINLGSLQIYCDI